MNNYTGAPRSRRKRRAEAPPFSFVKVSAAGTVLAKRARPLSLGDNDVGTERGKSSGSTSSHITSRLAVSAKRIRPHFLPTLGRET
ncbi:hypothetical protein LCGC14_1307610 [marine sediment metagenome]|uniref:Uncharacterized protein n=1 Tax=marine sediment metagenome TaxID=412755 RepID=A0A0F9L852_9ZZZZ